MEETARYVAIVEPVSDERVCEELRGFQGLIEMHPTLFAVSETFAPNGVNPGVVRVIAFVGADELERQKHMKNGHPNSKLMIIENPTLVNLMMNQCYRDFHRAMVDPGEDRRFPFAEFPDE